MSTDSLWKEVEAELADPRFANRTHYHRKTYDAGCRGPLCGQAAAERYRVRTLPNPPRPNARTIRRQEQLPLLVQVASQYGIVIASQI